VDNWKSNKMRTLFGCGSLEYTYVYKFQDNRFYFNIKKSGFEVTVPALIKIFKQAIADVYHYLNFISLHLPHFPFFGYRSNHTNSQKSNNIICISYNRPPVPRFYIFVLVSRLHFMYIMFIYFDRCKLYACLYIQFLHVHTTG